MPDLNYAVEGAEARLFAAEPTLDFRLRVAENLEAGAEPNSIHAAVLRCQIRVEPVRRSYSPAEKSRLLDLFGTPDRWGQTLRSMLWSHVILNLPPFEGSTTVVLPVPCSSDFSLAASKYFNAIETGDLPLCFLFSGTIFYRGPEDRLQVTQISWEKEADFRLPASTWRSLMEHYYANTTWFHLRKDVYERLASYRGRKGLPTSEYAIERLLDAAEELTSP